MHVLSCVISAWEAWLCTWPMTATLHTVSMNRRGWVPLMKQQYVHIFVLLKFKAYGFVLLCTVLKKQQQQKKLFPDEERCRHADMRARREEQLK